MTRRQLFLALLGLVALPVGAVAQPFSVTIGRNFTGSTAALLNPPPDTMGAAGIDHFVELNNHLFKVYRKSDGAVVQNISDSQFWTNAGATPTGNSFDPRLVYDPHARRWYAVGVDNGQNANSFLFAVSNSSDPTQSWTGFKIDTDSANDHWADFPMLGFNGEGVFISTVMIPLSAPSALTSVVVLPKYDLLQPVPSIVNMTQFQVVLTSTAGPVPQLAVDASNTFGTIMPMMSMSSAGGGSLVRSNISPPGSPSITNVGSIAANATQPPTVDQPGPSQNIEANDWRFSSNTVLRGNDLYAVQSVADQGLAAVRFLRIDATTNAVLESSIIVDPASRALTFPSIAVNEFGDVVIGVTGTSTTEFASSYALVGKTVAGVTTFNAPMLLKAGVDSYVRLDSLGRNRWGDYSATTVDPADPSIFWTTQEFVSGTNNWSTQVTELIVPQLNEARWADPVPLGNFDDATMWQTAHGGAPLPTDRVVFGRATDLSPLPITVNFPLQPVGVYANEAASVRQGNVVLDLNGNQWDLVKQLDVGPYAGHPQVTIKNGIVNSGGGFIANRPTAEGHLTLDNTRWNVSGQLLIGSDIAPGSAGLLPGAFGGTGSLTIVNNSEVTVAGLLRVWKAGTMNLVNGALTTATIQHTDGGAFNFTGGTLYVDTFNGELRNTGGTLSPGAGNSIGTTSIHPGYFQLSGGTLAIQLGGAGIASFDHLVTGLASLDGTLAVTLLAGYAPSLGDLYPIITGGSVLGTFSNGILASLGTRLKLHVFYNPSDVTLAVVPALAGDFNANGVVDGADYVVWRNTVGQTGIGLAADSNLDRQVNIVDLAIWRGNFGAMVPGSGSGGSIPEPATLSIVVIGLATMSCQRWARIS